MCKKMYCWQGETHILIPQKLEMIRRLESCESRTGHCAFIQYWTNYDCLWYREIVNAIFKQQTLKQSKLIQPDKVLCKWFTALQCRKTHDWAYDN